MEIAYSQQYFRSLELFIFVPHFLKSFDIIAIVTTFFPIIIIFLLTADIRTTNNVFCYFSTFPISIQILSMFTFISASNVTVIFFFFYPDKCVIWHSTFKQKSFRFGTNNRMCECTVIIIMYHHHLFILNGKWIDLWSVNGNVWLSFKIIICSMVQWLNQRTMWNFRSKNEQSDSHSLTDSSFPTYVSYLSFATSSTHLQVTETFYTY